MDLPPIFRQCPIVAMSFVILHECADNEDLFRELNVRYHETLHNKDKDILTNSDQTSIIEFIETEKGYLQGSEIYLDEDWQVCLTSDSHYLLVTKLALNLSRNFTVIRGDRFLRICLDQMTPSIGISILLVSIRMLGLTQLTHCKRWEDLPTAWKQLLIGY